MALLTLNGPGPEISRATLDASASLVSSSQLLCWTVPMLVWFSSCCSWPQEHFECSSHMSRWVGAKDENVRRECAGPKARGYLAMIVHCLEQAKWYRRWPLERGSTSTNKNWCWPQRRHIPNKNCKQQSSNSSVEYALKVWWRNSPPLGAGVRVCVWGYCMG